LKILEGIFSFQIATNFFAVVSYDLLPQSFNAFIKNYKEKKMRRIALSIFAFIICSANIFAQSEPEIMSYKEYGPIRHKRPYILKYK
jgi:hypothetical protein